MPDVQMNYETMEQMTAIFRAGAQQLGETAAAMEKLAQAMEDGALLGEGGDLFADALRARLAPRIKRLQNYFNEMARDVRGALVDLRDGDKTAESRFKG